MVMDVKSDSKKLVTDTEVVTSCKTQDQIMTSLNDPGTDTKKLVIKNNSKNVEHSPCKVSYANTDLNKFVANFIELTPLLPTFFNGQTDCSCTCPDSESSHLSTRSDITNKDSKSVQRSPLKTCLKSSHNSHYISDLNNSFREKQTVTFSDDTKRLHRDNQCSLADQHFSKFLHPKYLSMGLEVIPENEPIGVIIKCDSLDSKKQLSMKSDDKTSSNIVIPESTAVVCVPSLNATVSSDSTSKSARSWFIDIPMSGIKEKLTRRQMIQLGAAMGLGFILVLFILLWVFSPVLF